MTGRDLIVYILQNGLENEEVFKDGEFLGFLTLEQVAAKFGFGTATIETWVDLGWVKGYEFNGELYFPANIEAPELILKRKD